MGFVFNKPFKNHNYVGLFLCNILITQTKKKQTKQKEFQNNF